MDEVLLERGSQRRRRRGRRGGGDSFLHEAVPVPSLSPLSLSLLLPLRIWNEGRRFWRLSLPVGETPDHPLANPFGPTSPSLEPVKLDPILVIAGGNELLKDRVEDYARRLKELGKEIEYYEFEGKQHGFFTNEPYSDVSDEVLQLFKNFMSEL
ncbi:hypothetical protein RJ640_003205 [Escallonia rubra]|uniref:Alpha/beta hydrolase fold-3 domain-containing protein n=1 Tax=Escallonia rubra TaxID=112253 RepID=A0AA88UEZ3_9ASTE|nr:hypothetical protein RJ640_003205 [Escallonia rubra]